MREVIESKTNEIQVLGTQEFMGKQVPVIEGGFGIGQKVVLAKTVAEIHEVGLRKINELINNNIDEFEEGIDILDLKGNEDFAILAKDNGFYTQNALNASSNIYLLSEQGYLALVSLMRTDKAKELRKKFRREYFAMKQVLRVLTREQELVLDIHAGGVRGIEASKELAQIEVDKNSKIYEEKMKIQEENARLKLELVKKELKKKIDDLQDGNNKIMSVSQLVNNLEIPGLTTTIFNKWLCKKGFGEYKLFPGEKRRIFQPNVNFEKYISGKGYSLTGTTNKKNKVIVTYSQDMIKRIIDKYYEELCNIVEESEFNF